MSHAETHYEAYLLHRAEKAEAAIEAARHAAHRYVRFRSSPDEPETILVRDDSLLTDYERGWNDAITTIHNALDGNT